MELDENFQKRIKNNNKQKKNNNHLSSEKDEKTKFNSNDNTNVNNTFNINEIRNSMNKNKVDLYDYQNHMLTEIDISQAHLNFTNDKETINASKSYISQNYDYNPKSYISNNSNIDINNLDDENILYLSHQPYQEKEVNVSFTYYTEKKPLNRGNLYINNSSISTISNKDNLRNKNNLSKMINNNEEQNLNIDDNFNLKSLNELSSERLQFEQEDICNILKSDTHNEITKIKNEKSPPKINNDKITENIDEKSNKSISIKANKENKVKKIPTNDSKKEKANTNESSNKSSNKKNEKKVDTRGGEEKEEIYENEKIEEDIFGKYVDNIIKRSYKVYTNRQCSHCANLLFNGKSCIKCPKYHHLIKRQNNKTIKC